MNEAVQSIHAQCTCMLGPNALHTLSTFFESNKLLVFTTESVKVAACLGSLSALASKTEKERILLLTFHQTK